ncbi:MAG TPA: TIM barrel protein [Puia sp.]|nr:TIM barrel protein [Puia sp.]
MRHNRRRFIQSGSAAAAALFLGSLDVFPKERFMDNGFELKIMATNWGFEGTLDAYCAKAKKEGYDGIEIWWPMESAGQKELFAALKDHGLEVGFLCAGHQAEYGPHLELFKHMTEAAALNTIQRPLYINCHSGRDYFSIAQNMSLLDHTRALAARTGIVICHETHRSRMLFAAPVARHFIESDPDLRVTFDVSHWCNVSESLLQDQAGTLELTLSRVDHIHARIGHPEGPQVNDPRAPEWKAAVDAHFAWWDVVVARKKQEGKRLTILTEFGPPDYMPTLPYTRQPLGDQWAINAYMMHVLRSRYA